MDYFENHAKRAETTIWILQTGREVRIRTVNEVHLACRSTLCWVMLRARTNTASGAGNAEGGRASYTMGGVCLITPVVTL